MQAWAGDEPCPARCRDQLRSWEAVGWGEAARFGLPSAGAARGPLMSLELTLGPKSDRGCEPANPQGRLHRCTR